MYSEADLQSAVAAGALSHEAAEALRAHVSGIKAGPSADEEHFRLITGFNDIFVTIAAVLLLVAMAGIGHAVAPGVGGLLVAGTAWGLAEYFTRQRRMALPSIVLLIGFAAGLAAAPIEIAAENLHNPPESTVALLFAGTALLVAAGTWLHWRRFMVPITIAAVSGAVVATVIALIASALPREMLARGPEVLLPLVFLAGIGMFLFAMRWDTSDRARETRRSDVAFWLHLLAAPMIAHPLFHWIGVTEGENIAPAAAIGVIVVYVLLGLVALAVDRRALLVSALAYVLFALTWLFRQFGMVELNVAVTGLVIGSALLSLSAFWTPIRSAVVRQLPGGLQGRLPLAMA